MQKDCSSCKKPATSLFFEGESWICKHCYRSGGSDVPYFKETGENPFNPQASKVHLNDVRQRRLDPKTNKMFYYQAPKTYFFPKGQ